MSISKTNETRQIREWQALRQFEAARSLERSGDYQAARAALSGVWTTVGERPAIEKLSADLQAEALLRVGTLSGWIGSAQQIGGAQEFAKDLMSEAIRLFEGMGNTEKVAEAQTDLAICYWRLGAFDEARVLFCQAEENSRDDENKLRALVNYSAVEISCGQLDRAFTLLEAAAPLADTIADRGASGRYHLQRALLFKKLGGEENLDRALIEYSAASLHLAEAGDIRYLAAVENNIGMVLLQMGRELDALSHLDRARAIFVKLKESGRVAEVNEARAQVLIAQRSFAEAERAAFAAITTLERGDEHSLLATAYVTHGIALARMGNEPAARLAFLRAVEVAEKAGDLRSAGGAYLSLIEELSDSLASGEAGHFFLEADNRLGAEVNPGMMARFRKCARIVAANSLANPAQVLDGLLIGGTLDEELHHIEAVLIKRALDYEGGSITRAARSLGLTHQGLDWTLRNRQQQLLSSRTPRRPRRKSILKKK